MSSQRAGRTSWSASRPTTPSTNTSGRHRRGPRPRPSAVRPHPQHAPRRPAPSRSRSHSPPARRTAPHPGPRTADAGPVPPRRRQRRPPDACPALPPNVRTLKPPTRWPDAGRRARGAPSARADGDGWSSRGSAAAGCLAGEDGRGELDGEGVLDPGGGSGEVFGLVVRPGGQVARDQARGGLQLDEPLSPAGQQGPLFLRHRTYSDTDGNCRSGNFLPRFFLAPSS